MGTRGEVFTKSIKVKNRTYFFNVKENTKGDVFLQVVESKDAEGLGFERHSIVVFEDELQPFLTGLDESLRFIEASQKEKAKKRFEKLQAKREKYGAKTEATQKTSALSRKKPRKVVVKAKKTN